MITIKPLTITSPITINGRPVGLFDYIPVPTPSVPTDMDFIYFANNFDGSKIPNVASNSTFGDYLQYGTLVKNGSGNSCYLSKSGESYLYKDLTSTELNNIKAINNTYTFFIRMMQDVSYGTGGIMSCRLNGGYIYMIRCESQQLQIHTTGGYNCGSDFMLNVDRVYKVQISGDSFQAKNLDNNAVYNLNFSTDRSMGNIMTSFHAGYSGELDLDRFYAFAGIPRATTAEEDEQIKSYLLSQGT